MRTRRELRDERKQKEMQKREERLQYLRDYEKEWWGPYYEKNREKILKQKREKREEKKGKPLNKYSKVNLKGMTDEERKEYYRVKTREYRERRKKNAYLA